MGNTFFFDWEVSLIEWVQSIIGGFGETILKIITLFGEELIIVAIFGFLYWAWDKEKAKKIGLPALFCTVVNPMIKQIFIRRRPYFDHDSIKCLKPVTSDADIYDINAQGYSFPSGHSMNSASIYPSLGLYFKKNWLRIIGIIMPILIGISRFSLGVHYPTDVIVGWIVGAAIMFVLYKISDKINKYVLYAILFAIAIPGWFYCETNDFFSGFGIFTGFIVATEFESRFVKFKNTRNPLRCVLRVVIGGGIFFGFNQLLKMPFDSAFLDAPTLGSHAIRAARYAICTFVVTGLYPAIFAKADKIFNRGKKK